MRHDGQTPLWQRIRGVTAGYATGIVRLIGESYGMETIQTAWLEFDARTQTAFDFGDPHTELFFSWLFHRWSPKREKGDRVNDASLYGVSPTRAYLDEGASTVHPLLRRYLEICLVTSPGFYEIRECVPKVGFRAVEVMTGAEYQVSEELTSTSLADGDIVFAHLISIEGTTVLEAISPVSLPASMKRRLIRFSRNRQSAPTSGAAELRELYFSLVSPRQGARVAAAAR